MANESRTAVITGASGGIGRSTAERLAMDGFNVVINYRSDEKRTIAEKTAEICRCSGVRAEIFRADVSSEEDCEAMIAYATGISGSIDVVVNNAGIARYGLLTRMKSDDYHEVIRCNQDSVFFMMKHAAKIMKKQRSGRIINISSMAGITGSAGGLAYAASKAAVIAMTRSAAKELAGRNITVNAVAPGMVETGMDDVMGTEARSSALKKIGLGRYARPEEIAAAVSYLASDEAAYVTGAVLEIHGGLIS